MKIFCLQTYCMFSAVMEYANFITWFSYLFDDCSKIECSHVNNI